ncbi:MAG: diguanylate cyclase, partial [Planctomycetes bacterium]|nr:diguanylate cyclase [Planctomycetota bacterium]
MRAQCARICIDNAAKKMDNSAQIPVSQEPTAASENTETASQRLTAITDLLQDLDETQQADGSRSKSELAYQNQLVVARLGIASSLFMSLRAKHAPTASHSLRVALACSSWALSMDVTDELRDEIEIAALLHDIGKLGVPDKILQKSAKLTFEEAQLVERQRQLGLEILRGCISTQEILDAVKYAGAWYDGCRSGYDRRGEELPFGARILAIVDAFDSMTTDHVYRRAMSRERATAELFECAGGQFDPHLVKDFCTLLGRDQVKFNDAVAHRWLQELHPQASDAMWALGKIFNDTGKPSSNVGELFQQKLVDSMHDGVVFVDQCLKILLWNRAAERLTGLPASSVMQKQWLPSLVQMRDENDVEIHDSECPMQYAIETGSENLMRLSIAARGDGRISVDAHFVPITSDDGSVHGAAVMLHDASSEITLSQRVERLHVQATQDPLTQVANRAEFDRVNEIFVRTHLQQGKPCCLIICDLDFFKKVNDTYGHQAGDEALVSFAALLKRFHHAGDLVARYGGEEFVMLCANCDNATATDRAEKIRRELQQIPQSMLGSRCITATFGVTEVKDGDTPETMLRRADRALLQAKDAGRNTVVQLGAGISGNVVSEKKRGIFSWFQSSPP